MLYAAFVGVYRDGWGASRLLQKQSVNLRFEAAKVLVHTER